jgi:hypothetical protein
VTGILLQGLAVAAGAWALWRVLPSDFTWGDHSVYYWRIVEEGGFGLDARAYSAWAWLGKPFLAIRPGLAGYHAYLLALYVAQAILLLRVLARCGAPALLASALVFAHAISYPLRSVGLMSSPKVLWFIAFDLLVLAFIALSSRRTNLRLLTVLALWVALVLLHRLGVIVAVPVFLALALLYPRARAAAAAVLVATAGAAALFLLFLNRESSGSGLWAFFLSHFTIGWPRDPVRILVQVGGAVLSGGIIGVVVLLPGWRAFRGRGALLLLLLLSALGTLAFAVLHPSGEKAMFVLPALHCGVIAAGVLASEGLRWPAGRAVAVAGVALLIALALPGMVERRARLPAMKGPWHDYARDVFGLRAGRPGIDYARAVVAATPEGAVLRGDWGVLPLLRHVLREKAARRGPAARMDGSGPDRMTELYVASPWNRLPAEWRGRRIRPLADLRAAGLEVGVVDAP